MPIDISWLVSDRVVYMRSYKDVTLDETRQANAQIITMLDNGTPLVHVIINQTELGNFPISVNEYRNVLTAMTHESLGWIVVYGPARPMADFIAVMVARLGRLKYRKLALRAEAIQFLVQKDASLKPHFDEVT